MPENKSYLDSLADRGNLESFQEEKFVRVTNKSKRQRIITLVVIAAILLAASLYLYYRQSNVSVPRLVGMTLEEANIWATKNRVILVSKSVYSFDIDSGTVVSQEISAGSSVARNSALPIEVSLGPDPEEKIVWPDIKSLTANEIKQWISENKLTGVRIVTVNSNVVAADQVISYSLTDSTEENFLRKSRATINVSLGPAAESDTVVVTDFTSMKVAAILQWGQENGVTISLSEAFDDYIASGSVISQSVKASTEIKKGEPVTVVISQGKPITVPDFAALLQEEANTWGKENGVTLITQQRYSSGDSKGSLLAQNIPAGTIIKAGDQIKLIYSLGPIELASFVGKTKLDILNWQNEVNAKGGNISLSFSEAYGEKGTAGKIISQSIKNDYVAPGTKISVVTSLGMRLLTPDFSGMTEAACKSLAQSLGLTVLFTYQSSNTVAKGSVISQSPASNTVISDATQVTIKISLTGTTATSTTGTTGTTSKIAVPDFKILNKDEANAWAKANNISLVFVEKYNNDNIKGILYEQNAAAGSEIGQGSYITIGYSLGQIEMVSFIGKTKLELLTWLTAVNGKSGNITAVFTIAHDHSYAMNMIIGQSVMNTYVKTGTTVDFQVSWDPAVPSPAP